MGVGNAAERSLKGFTRNARLLSRTLSGTFQRQNCAYHRAFLENQDGSHQASIKVFTAPPRPPTRSPLPKNPTSEALHFHPWVLADSIRKLTTRGQGYWPGCELTTKATPGSFRQSTSKQNTQAGGSRDLLEL